jgi:hypothetical protein
MGMYTGIIFKGIIKKELRKDFKDIAEYGKWEESNDKILYNFSKISRYRDIPCGALCYMPESWDEDVNSKNKKYDINTGFWSFKCSLKNYDYTIEEFFKIIPHFTEYLIYLEYLYEDWEESKYYKLEDNKIIEV